MRRITNPKHAVSLAVIYLVFSVIEDNHGAAELSVRTNYFELVFVFFFILICVLSIFTSLF